MPIQVNCSQCANGLKAPDVLAGKKAKCPACGAVVDVPGEEILDAELADFAPAAAIDPAADLRYILGDDNPYLAQPAQPTGEEIRRPCPACGESIMATAAKCHFCGEIVDATLKRRAKRDAAYAKLTGTDWVLACIFPVIGFIVGIVLFFKGSPKANKMIGISVVMNIVWRLGYLAFKMAAHNF